MNHGIGNIQQSKLPVALYIVATPIGNLQDITLRALNILASVELIACEDTRVTHHLLNHYCIGTKLIPYNDHSGVKDRNRILHQLSEGNAVALVSDAGTPLISDPGYRLVQEVRNHGYNVITIPGSSSVTAGLAIAGQPTDHFYFGGFLPTKSKECVDYLKTFVSQPFTLVFFESARRLNKTLALIKEALGNRSISVLRELTKQFEEVQVGSIDEILMHYEHSPAKGELLLVIAPQREQMTKQLEPNHLAIINACLPYMPKKAITALVGELSGVSKKSIYHTLLSLEKNQNK